MIYSRRATVIAALCLFASFVAAGLLSSATPAAGARLSFPGGDADQLTNNHECVLTRIAVLKNIDQYRDAVEGNKFASRGHELRLELANGWFIANYTPLNVAFGEDARTILSFRTGDAVQACPITRHYCSNDRGLWQVVLRIYDMAAKRAITGKQTQCPGIVPEDS